MPTTIIVTGRLGRDAEIKDINDKRVMELTIADNCKVAGVKHTIWRKATFWNDDCAKLEKFLTKGALITITGEDRPVRIYVSNGETKVDLSMTGKMIQFISIGKKDEEKTSHPQTVNVTGSNSLSDVDDLPF